MSDTTKTTSEAPTPEAPKKTTLTVTIDGTAMEANPGELLIAAAERTGTYIPRFCWHPRMREVGMCRMCLVEVSGPRGMSLQPACMQPCGEGMVVDTKSDTVKKAQDGVLEFLLINHPLDCPVCDKGGECPLQDQTLTFGPGESRFVEEKRHYEKPIAISDLVLLDRERCILCDRCTRFSKEVAGDPLIHFVNRGNMTEVNTFPDDPFASYFSGNVVQICPVGALTAKPYRFAARPWDLDQVESTCTTCSVGCKTVIQSSGDRITRYQGVDSDPVNWGWLCDKGRFGFEAVSSPERFTNPLMRSSAVAALERTTWAEALGVSADRLRAYQPSEIGVIGGARLTNEDQYAWAKLAKSVLRTDNVDAQLGDGLPAEAVLGLPGATIDDAMKATAVVLLSADVKEELPVLFLRLRDAAANRHVPMVELSPIATGITKYAGVSVRYRPGEVVGATHALLAAFGGSPAERQIAGVEGESLNAAAALLSKAIESGKGNGKVVVVLGPTADSASAVLEAAAALHAAVPNVSFLPTLRRSNVRGALDLGLTPGMLPGRVTLTDGAAWFASHWSAIPSGRGLETVAMLEAAAAGTLKALVLLGADLADCPDHGLVERALANVEFLLCVDTLPNTTNRRADVVLPAAGYAEKDGTTTNLEGRVTRVASKVSAPGVARADWTIAALLAMELGADLGFESVADVTAEVARVAPSHVGLVAAVLDARANTDGVLLPLASVAPSVPETSDSEGPAGPALPALVTFRAASTTAVVPTPDSYSMRLVTVRSLYDQGTLVQACESLSHLAPTPGVHLNPGEIERHGLRAGGSVKVLSQSADLTATVISDDRVPRGVAVLPLNLGGGAAGALVDLSTTAKEGITKVRLETAGS